MQTINSSLRAKQGTSLIELLVSIVILSVIMVIALQAVTSGRRLEHATISKLAQYDTARPVFELMTQDLARDGQGLVTATPTVLVWRSVDATRKSCSRLTIDEPTKQLRYETKSVGLPAADPSCPDGSNYRVLATGVSTSGQALFSYEDEPGVTSASNQRLQAARVIVRFAIADNTEKAQWRERTITVGR